MTTEPKSDPNHSSSNTTGYSKNGSGSMKHHVQAAATNNLAVVVNDQINMSSLSSVGLSSSSESSARLLLNTNNASVTPSSGIKVSPVFVPSTSSLGDIKPVVPAVAADDEASCMVLPAIPSPLSSASSASVNNVLFSKRTSSLPSSEIVEKKLMGGIKGSSGNNNKPHNTTTTAASTVGWVGLFSGIIPKSVSSNSSSRAHFVINEGGSSSHQILKEDHQDFELGGEEEATALSKSSSTKFTDNRQSVADMFNYITKQEKLLEKLDNSSAKFTLARLERENQLLELNPKTILAESGTYRTTTTTLHDLKSATGNFLKSERCLK